MKYFEEKEKKEERKGKVGEKEPLYKILGDVEIEESLLEALRSFYTRPGGRYSVLTDEETILGLLEMKGCYGLTAEAIRKLGYHYIRDMFEKYSLKETLQDFIDKYGRKDATFEIYLSHVEDIESLDQKEYLEKGKELDSLKDEYGEKLVEYLKRIVLRRHIDPETIKKYLPESSLIEKDEIQLLRLSVYYQITCGFSTPISYRLIEEMTRDKSLSRFPEELSYYVTTRDKRVEATFTKQEFLESMKKRQEYYK